MIQSDIKETQLAVKSRHKQTAHETDIDMWTAKQKRKMCSNRPSDRLISTILSAMDSSDERNGVIPRGVQLKRISEKQAKKNRMKARMKVRRSKKYAKRKKKNEN